MFQVPTGYRTRAVTAVDTNAARFASNIPGGLVTIQAHPSNTGTITILGCVGDTIDSAGPILNAGDFLPPQYLNMLDQLAYKASVSNDVILVMTAK